MRENLFIGKRKDNGECVYGDLIHRRIWGNDVVFIRVEDNGFDSYVEYEVIPETVGRCTGIPDRNNRKMYDGDLCCFSIFPGRDDTLVKISYRYGTPGYEPVFPEQVHPDDREWKSFYRHEEREMISPHYFRVIGNIHDNPEFLEVEHWKD